MDSFTFGYASFQIIVLFIVLGILWKNKGWHAHTNTAASILTVVGVLGTFIGIYIGLWAFKTDLGNMEEMQGSISKLLDGLKLAFGTSIVGIASALLLKGIISPLAQKSQQNSDEDPEQKTIGRFVDVLTKALSSVETTGESKLSAKLEALITAIKDSSKTTHDQLKTLTNTISNEHNQLMADRKTTRNVLDDMRKDLTDIQGKVLNQLETMTNTVSNKNDLIIASQKNEGIETRKILTDMQSELTDRQSKTFIQLRALTKTVSYEHNQLRKEFDTFSKNVAESITELATKELISSLTKVINNFNTTISDQFGDNFKQLNEAVGKTVDWQKQYRQDMDKLADEFQIAAKSIDDSRDSLKNIADSSSIIATRSESIVTSTTKLEPILHTLNDQLVAFSDLRQKANGAFPLIEGRLDDLTTKFSDAVQEAITDSQAQSKQLVDQFNQFQNVINGLDDFTSKINKVTTDVSNIVKDLQKIIDSQTQALQNSVQYVTNMEQRLNNQLAASIEALAGGLASLSEKFVDDYTPLTQRLRTVLTIAEGILPRQPGN